MTVTISNEENERDHHIAFLAIERLPLFRMTRTANGFFPLLSAENDSLGSTVLIPWQNSGEQVIFLWENCRKSTDICMFT